MADTRIEWADRVWNPTTGCSKVSQGCKHCYAERMAKRLAGRLGYPADDPFRVTLHPHRLDLPLRWKKPRRIFVNSMSDLFHPDVPDEFIDQVFGAMLKAYWHTFQVLTKRPQRMAQYLSQTSGPDNVISRIYRAARNYRWYLWSTRLLPRGGGGGGWPLPNVWLGVSAEHQQAADERIPLLLQTPAAVRWVSAEPLLGPLDVRRYLRPQRLCEGHASWECDDTCPYLHALDWVVAGGESGPGARPMHPDWARSLRDQCATAGVPFYFKQWGEWRVAETADWSNPKTKLHEIYGTHYVRVGKQAAGRLLDGHLHDEYPEVRT